MENKKPLSSIVAGIILGVLLIVMSFVLEAASGGKSSAGGGWLTYIIIIGGLILFIHLYAKAKDNYVSFGELFSYGFKATSMMALVFLIYILILAYVSPEIKDKAIEQARIEFEKKGGMPQNDIDKAMGIMEKYFWLAFAGGALLVFLIIGCIGSLIGAAVTKKHPKNPMTQLDQLDQLKP